jgi:hypothetical protein
MHSFASIITIISYIIILVYLARLQEIKCKCADSYKKYYIIVFISFILLLNLIALLLGKKKKLSKLLIIILLLATITNSIFIIQYIYELYRKKCDCANNYNFSQFIMLFVAYFHIFLLIFSLLFIVILKN